jgi:hypothetical protein
MLRVNTFSSWFHAPFRSVSYTHNPAIRISGMHTRRRTRSSRSAASLFCPSAIRILSAGWHHLSPNCATEVAGFAASSVCLGGVGGVAPPCTHVPPTWPALRPRRCALVRSLGSTTIRPLYIPLPPRPRPRVSRRGIALQLPPALAQSTRNPEPGTRGTGERRCCWHTHKVTESAQCLPRVHATCRTWEVAEAPTRPQSRPRRWHNSVHGGATPPVVSSARLSEGTPPASPY